MKKILNLIMFWCLAHFLFFQSCEKTPMQPKNQPPLISSLTANPSNLDWNETCQLVVVAVDPEGGNLSYSWTVTGGLFLTETTGDTVIWQAPDSSGSFICTVYVSDEEGEAKKSITLPVSEHPMLSLDKDTLSFGTSTNSLSFNITNKGTGVLNWIISTTTDDGGSWIINTTPSQGSVATNNINEVTVMVDRSGLSGETFQGWVKVNSNDGSDSVRVIMDVAILDVDKESLDFEPSVNTLEFIISNSGKGNLEWTINSVTDDGGNWLSVNPTKGTTTTDKNSISVNVERSGLNDGEYYGWVKIESNGGNDSMRVHMTVINPKLAVEPLILEFGDDSNELNFEIKNDGYGTLKWEVSETEPWLAADPTSGSTTTETDKVTVNVNRSGLSEGNYVSQISVDSNGGNQIINVSMRVIKQALFFDDFSGDLSNWTKQSCTAWISNGEVHVKGNRSGYYGTLRHSFSSYITVPYIINVKLSRVGYAGSDDHYGLYTNVNDTGFPAIPYFYFTIWPAGSGMNWAVFAFLSAGSSSQWVLIASDSKGYSSLIKTGINQWNGVSWNIESDKTIVIKLGEITLYQTDEIKEIEDTFGITISMNLKKFGIRTTYNFEVKADDVEVIKPGFSITGLEMGNELPAYSEHSNDQNIMTPPQLNNLFDLLTLKEVLSRIRK